MNTDLAAMQRAFYEKAEKACEAFLEKHGEYPRRIGVKIMGRSVPLLAAAVVLALPDSYTRITVPWYSHEVLEEDDMLLWHPNVGVVTLKELGIE